MASFEEIVAKLQRQLDDILSRGLSEEETIAAMEREGFTVLTPEVMGLGEDGVIDLIRSRSKKADLAAEFGQLSLAPSGEFH